MLIHSRRCAVCVAIDIAPQVVRNLARCVSPYVAADGRRCVATYMSPQVKCGAGIRLAPSAPLAWPPAVDISGDRQSPMLRGSQLIFHVAGKVDGSCSIAHCCALRIALRGRIADRLRLL